MSKIKGIISAMVTPMIDGGKIYENGLRMLVSKLINAGVHGLFPLGTTGEFFALTEEEKVQIVKVVIDETAGRVPVYAGTGGISTNEVIERTKRMEGLGISGISVITPYFISPSQYELFYHYEKIAKATKTSVILYNIPGRTGVHLEPKTVSLLSEIDNIVGIKDSSGNFENIKGYIENTSDDFSVMAGTDSLIYATLEAGGSGAVAATSNVVSQLVVSIYENYLAGDLQKAKEAQERLIPLRSTFSMGTLPSVIKEAVCIAGIPAGAPRGPVLCLSDIKAKELKDIILKNYSEIKR